MSRYGTLIQYLLQLKNGKLHSKVMRVVDDLLEEGIDYKKTVKLATRKYRHMLENYLDEVIDNENSEERMMMMKKKKKKKKMMMMMMMRRRRRRRRRREREKTDIYKRTLFSTYFILF
jgi:MoaA/NifB/PqqE/SkfB family radical SAM enzyme